MPDKKYLLKGDTVSVRAHKSEPGKGLSYNELSGTLLDDVYDSEGWVVVDVLTNGVEVSIYCFSIKREEV